MYPEAPARSACSTYSSLACMESITTRTSGRSCLSRALASSPPIPGMEMSSSTTSGRCLRASSSTSLPLPASATTVTPCRLPEARVFRRAPMRDRPREVRVPGSCLSRARPDQREREAQPGLPPERRVDRKPPAGERRALFQAQQAHALAGRRPQSRGRDVETPTIVAHLHTQFLLRAGERNPNFARLRVARDIGERLLRDAKARSLDLGGETRGYPLMREIRLEPGAACLPVEM